MNKQKDLDQLLCELQSLLTVLDTEELSCVAELQKESVAELLQGLRENPSDDADYMFMSCVRSAQNQLNVPQPQYGNELQGVLEIVEDPVEVPPCPPSPDDWQLKLASRPLHNEEVQGDQSYEVTELLTSAPAPSGGTESDSSHYESYGEDEVGPTTNAGGSAPPPGPPGSPRLGTPSSPRPPASPRTPASPARDARICGFLWRKKWLGKWSKQLVVVREQVLMCYKCIKDRSPLLTLCLRGCRVSYRCKRGKKMEHEVKVTGASGETLVLGLISAEQAQEWRQIIEEASSRPRPHPHPHVSACASSQCSPRPTTSGLESSSESEACAGEETADKPGKGDSGALDVLMNSDWQRFNCRIENRVLLMYRDMAGTENLHSSLYLRGCEVSAGAGGSRPTITVRQQGMELASLQAGSVKEGRRWMERLQAGCRDEPDAEIYEDTVIFTQTPATNNSHVSSLSVRRLTTPNPYMDDPFVQEAGNHSVSLERSIHPPADPHPQASGRDFAAFLGNHTNNNNHPSRLDRLPDVSPEGRFPKSWSNVDLQGYGAERERERVRSQWTQTDKKDFKEATGESCERRTLPRLEEKMRRLEQAMYRAKEKVHSGSQLNLLSLSKTFKRASCGHTLSFFHSNSSSSSSEASQGLRRTMSAKGSLKRSPSVIVVDKGRVLQKTQEWEAKYSV